MKHIYVVINHTENDKNFATADTIRVGTNLMALYECRNVNIVHLCETRMQAERIALEWNKSYKANGTYMF